MIDHKKHKHTIRFMSISKFHNLAQMYNNIDIKPFKTFIFH